MRPRLSGSVTSMSAAGGAVATLVCCLPLGFAAGTAMASVSLVVAEYRTWFLAASALLLAIGFVQLRRAGRSCDRRPVAPLAVFTVCAAVVALVVFFPQVIAGLLADVLP